MMVALYVTVAAVLGFFLPGFVVARKACPVARVEAGFLLSCLVLFFTFVGFNAVGVRMRFWPVAGVLAGVSVVLYLATWRVKAAATGERPVGPGWSWPVLVAIGAVVAVFAWRVTVSPLAGEDTAFRWDRLGARIAGLGHLRFYPPRGEYDYRHYFYCDSFPPLVSVGYAWLYMAAGLHLRMLTAVFVVAQFVATISFTARAGAVLLDSPRGGALAGLLLAGCPMVFWWTGIGQETGVMALSAAATLYFLGVAATSGAIAPVVLAGAAAAVAALAREYGPAYVVLALAACAWLRLGWRRTATFAGTALLLTAPWYVRTWYLTGNPIYSNPFLGLPVNRVIAEYLEHCSQVFALRTWSAGDWAGVIGTILVGAPLVLPAGLVAGAIDVRRRGYLLAFGVGVIGLFFWSVSHTAGGRYYATRVVMPAMVPLAILAAGVVGKLPRAVAVGVATAAFTVVWCWPFPTSPTLVQPGTGQSFVSAYLMSGLYAVSQPGVEPRLVDGIRANVPKGGTILTDNMYLPQVLEPAGIRTVPVWRPDLVYLVDGSTAPDEALRRLRSAGIGFIVYQPGNSMGEYLRRFPAFDPDAGRTTWLTQRDVIISVP